MKTSDRGQRSGVISTLSALLIVNGIVWSFSRGVNVIDSSMAFVMVGILLGFILFDLHKRT